MGDFADDLKHSKMDRQQPDEAVWRAWRGYGKACLL